jgi:hypothetical protein
MRGFVLNQMVHHVDPGNTGPDAGLYGHYNLGNLTTPVHITPANVLPVIDQLRTLLAERNHWVENQMFLIVPYVFGTVISQSPLASAAFAGDGMSRTIDGRWPNQVNGFNIYETNHLPQYRQGGNVCFSLIAGHRDAYTYASDIVLARKVQDINSATTKIQIVAAWGGAMLHPDWIGVMTAWFDLQLSA